MAARIVLYVLMALGLVGFGTVAWVASHPDTVEARSAQPAADRPVLVAAKPLRAGALLKPEDLTAKKIPAAEAMTASEDAPAARSALFGAMIRRSLAPGEPFLAGDVLHPGDHGFLAAVLGTGLRAFTLPLDSIESDASLLWPGDRVDVVLTQTDDKAPAARRTFGETLMTDVRVIAIDQRLVQGAAADEKEKSAKTITLEVTQEGVERLAVARRLGKLVLSTRAADQPSDVSALAAPRPVWAADVSPGLEDAPHPVAAAAAPAVVRVFSGAKDGKEFKF
jgi:pilus assembly protein CpaB